MRETISMIRRPSESHTPSAFIILLGLPQAGDLRRAQHLRTDGLPLNVMLQDLIGSGHTELTDYSDHDLRDRLARIARGLASDDRTPVSDAEMIDLLDKGARAAMRTP
jgi:hypothetical protein